MAGNEDHGEGAGADHKALIVAAIKAELEPHGGGCVYGPDWEWDSKELEAVAARVADRIVGPTRPSDAELEIDLFNALVEVGNLPESVRVADIDHQAVAQRLAELGWVRP